MRNVHISFRCHQNLICTVDSPIVAPCLMWPTFSNIHSHMIHSLKGMAWQCIRMCRILPLSMEIKGLVENWRFNLIMMLWNGPLPWLGHPTWDTKILYIGVQDLPLSIWYDRLSYGNAWYTWPLICFLHVSQDLHVIIYIFHKENVLLVDAMLGPNVAPLFITMAEPPSGKIWSHNGCRLMW